MSAYHDKKKVKVSAPFQNSLMEAFPENMLKKNGISTNVSNNNVSNQLKVQLPEYDDSYEMDDETNPKDEKKEQIIQLNINSNSKHNQRIRPTKPRMGTQ